jgi:hypothetical protein
MSRSPGGAVILRPVTMTVPGERLTAVREKIAALGMSEKDVEAAIRMARSKKS